MNLMLNRLDPRVPDPVESRRRAAGRMVRIAYATIVFGVLAFFVIYFGRPLVYLSGPGVVSAPRYVVSSPYVVQISHMNVTPGSTVAVGEEIGRVQSPQQEGVVATYMRALAEIAGREAELRVKARVARESLETTSAYLHLTEEAVESHRNLAHHDGDFPGQHLSRARLGAQKRSIVGSGSRRGHGAACFT